MVPSLYLRKAIYADGGFHGLRVGQGRLAMVSMADAGELPTEYQQLTFNRRTYEVKLAEPHLYCLALNTPCMVRVRRVA
jgi:hypothetical protein